MIISFKNINGGGGGGYVLPTATPTRLGGVKIGDGINVDSAGTISVSGCSEAEMALALKSRIDEGDDFKVVNDGGWLYNVEQNRDSEEGIFVKVYQNADYVEVYIDLSGQTAPEGDTIGIVLFGDVAITLDENGDLLYYNGEDDVYYDSATTEYQYGDFTFNWSNDGKDISFEQNAVNPIMAEPQTGNFDRLYEIARNLYMANQDTLGLVKIGSGITLSDDGTISVDGGGIEVVDELPASGTDGQVVVLNYHSDTEITIDESGKSLETYSVSVAATNVAEQTFLYNYEWWGEVVNVYVDENNAVTLESQRSGTSETFDVGTVDDTYTMVGDYDNTETLTINVYETGFTIEQTQRVDKQNFIKNVEPSAEYKLYKWSEYPTPSIDALLSNNGYMIEVYYNDIPEFEGSAFTIFNASFDGGATSTPYCYYSDGDFYNVEDSNTPLIADGEMHNGPWGNSLYYISDGYIKFISNNLAISYTDTGIWNGQMNTTGWTEYGREGARYNGENCYIDFPIKFNGNSPTYGNTNIYVPTSIGTNGQILKTNGEGVYWDDPEKKEVVVYEVLPPFGAEDEIGIVNSGVSYTPSNAFLAANTTSPDGKNNFNDNTEFSHIHNGSYIYFDCNGELTTSTAKTFLYRIAMRTNENGDWNTSNLAYINVFREYDNVSQEHFYSWEMPPFDYKDDQGNDFTYSDSGTVDSSTTANTTSYLPLWKWWDGGYGYKFTFEYDIVADTLKVWLNHSSVDQIQGENYGDVSWECRNHTKEFCEYETDPSMSEVYVFKGGAWYKLGDLTQVGV